MRALRSVVASVVLFLALVGNGCGSAVDIQGTWVLESLEVGGQPYLFPVEHPRKNPSIDGPAVFRFSDGRVWGEAPCNAFDGTYEFDGHRLVCDIRQEAILCADEAWNQADQRIFGVFSMGSIEVSLSGNGSHMMTLSVGGLVLTLRRATSG